MTTATLSTGSNATVPATNSRARYARYARGAARYLLGTLFFVCGLNGFLNFLPQPTDPMPEAALAFAGALMKTGYMFPLIKGTETLAGALLLANCFVPLALVILAPVLVNIVAFHTFLTPGEVGLPIALLCIELFLAWSYRAAYRPLLTRRATVS
jgi:uncharacterized membrane protein YphA (DoxX/SURF4 family)